MRHARPLVVAFLLFAAATATAATAVDDPIVGEWLTGDGAARVKIVPDGAAFGGTIVWLKEPNGDDGKPRHDEHAADAARRGDPVIGLKIVAGLTRVGDDAYADGTIYDPKSGKTYRCKATLADGDRRLDLRGFIGFSLFGRTDSWKRVATPAP